MTTEPVDLSSVCRLFGLGQGPGDIEDFGAAGGFSGARFWKIIGASGSLCLRRWPSEHPSRQRLQWLHRVLCGAAEAGFRKLPLPIRCAAGSTIVEHGGHLWELTPWLAGRADYHEHPSDARLESALAAL